MHVSLWVCSSQASHPTHSLGLATVSPRLWLLAVCVFVLGGTERCLNSTWCTPPFWASSPKTPRNIWEHMNQMWEMLLQNLLTTYWLMNCYTISSVYSKRKEKILDPIGNLLSLFPVISYLVASQRVNKGWKLRRNYLCQESWAYSIWHTNTDTFTESDGISIILKKM